MCWLKRNLWKTGIAIAGMLLLLVLMAWLPVTAASAHEVASGLAAPLTVTVQATPTVDATVTALNKEKLAQEVQQLKNQNEPDLLGWLRTSAPILLSTLVVVIGGLIGLFRWFGDRRDAREKDLRDRQNEREKRAEERFQAAVTGLGDEKEGAKIGAAILLRTFLRPGYEEFYTQTFDLAVANLQLRNVNPNTPEPLDTLSQALITVFKESFPRARDRLKEVNPQFSPQSLDARGIQLDNANLNFADLEQAWMPQAYLREANLFEANLSRANLGLANLSGANLIKINLSRASLFGANLSGAKVNEASLSGTILNGADLGKANLFMADLRGANLEDARSLKDTYLRGAKGLTKEQLEVCKAKGAIIDEVFTTSSSQSTIPSPQPSQSNDGQAKLTPSTQEGIPTPDADERSAPSSKPGSES